MSRRIGILVSVILSAGSNSAASKPDLVAEMEIQAPATAPAIVRFNFEKDAVGTVPAGIFPGVIGTGSHGQWKIKTDSNAPSYPNVLAQTGQVDPGNNFSVAIIVQAPLQDADVTTAFKAVSGDSAQGAAIVYRCTNSQNFYVLVADAQNDTFTLSRSLNGKWKQIDQKQVIVTANIWHKLRLIYLQNTYRAYMDDELALAGKDKALLGAGRLAIATPADAVTYFDDVSVSPAKTLPAPRKH